MNIVTEIAAAGQSNDGATKIVPARLAHFVLRTQNAKRLVAWYKTVFQADAVFDNGQLAFLYFDDEHHRIAVAEFPGVSEPAPLASAIDHVAFSYSSISDLLRTYGRLKSEGIEPFAKLDHGPTTSFYYKDPDGNQIELQVDNFTNRDDAHAYFTSQAFLDNPIGVEIDPDAMLAQLESGTEPSELLSLGTRGAINTGK